LPRPWQAHQRVEEQALVGGEVRHDDLEQEIGFAGNEVAAVKAEGPLPLDHL
jgi:hypothetical protein